MDREKNLGYIHEQIKGQEYDYLGHFTNEEVIESGHNMPGHGSTSKGTSDAY